MNLPWWFLRSTEVLNSSVKSIRRLSMKSLEQEKEKTISCKDIFETTSEQYFLMDDVKKQKFDVQATFLCLMLRKELGEAKLHSLLSVLNKNGFKYNEALKYAYGYIDLKEFNEKYNMYYDDLTKALRSEEVPDSYFEIVSVKKEKE